MMLQHDMQNAASDLRAGRGSVDQADSLLRRGGQLRMHLPPAHQPELTAAMTELRAARDERATNERPVAAVEPPPAGPTRAQRLEQRMIGALRRLPEGERAVAQHLSHALLGHSGSAATVRALGRMSEQELEGLMDRANVSAGDREAVRDAVVGILGHAFHREVVATAERAFDRGIASFERVGRGGRDLDRFVSELEGPNAYRILDSLSFAGAVSEERALRETLERTHVDPSLRGELGPEIRRLAAAAARGAAESLSTHRDETFGDGYFASDPSGFAYSTFPGAVPLAAQRLGMSPEHATAITDSPHETLLERAAAERLHAAERTQTNGRRMAVATAIVTSVITAGTIGFAASGLVAGLVVEAPELAAAEGHLEETERAASVGMASREQAREARVERNIAASAAAVSLGAEGVGAATAGAHTHGALAAVAEAGVTHLPGTANAVRHEVGHH
jgi:hypothetical protein